MADVYPEQAPLGCSEEFDMDEEEEEFVPATPSQVVVEEGPSEPPAPKKRCVEKSKFRLNARQLFLTYPKCPIEKEEALSLVKEKLKADPEDYVVAQEKHKVRKLSLLQSKPFLSATEFMNLTDPERKFWENNLSTQLANCEIEDF